MISRPFTFEREDLYAKVWSIPMVQLAREYGLSDRGLAKICNKLEIPVPPRGYWARQQNGKLVNQPPLPRLSLKGKKEYQYSGIKHEPPPKRGIHLEPEVWEELNHQLKGLHVPLRLKDPHPLIEKFQKATAKRPPERKGLWSPDQWSFDKGRYISKRDSINILVSPPQFDRALRIMDTVIKFIENIGGEVFISNDGHSTIFKVREEDFNVRLVERYSTERLPPKDSWSKYNLQYHPNGIFEFRIGGLYSYKTLKDGKRKRLEDLVHEIIITFYDEVKRREIARAEAERERLRQEEREKIRRAEENRRQMETDA